MMDRPATDDGSATAAPDPWPVTAALGVTLLLGGGLLGFGLLARGLHALVDAPTVARPVAAAEAAGRVTEVLLGWEVFGPIPLTSPPDPRRGAVERGIRGIRGRTESGGWNGDGSDWYEVELPPELADELRAVLSHAPAIVSEATHLIQPSESWPPWWPKRWPAGTRWYHQWGQDKFLILPPTGVRAWLYNSRS